MRSFVFDSIALPIHWDSIQTNWAEREHELDSNVVAVGAVAGGAAAADASSFAVSLSRNNVAGHTTWHPANIVENFER